MHLAAIIRHPPQPHLLETKLLFDHQEEVLHFWADVNIDCVDQVEHDVTFISGPVPMRTSGVIKPSSIAGRIPEEYVLGEPSLIYMHCTPFCAVLPITLLPVTIQKAQYMASGRLRLQKFIPESAVE